MSSASTYEIWLLAGSQELYGEDVLAQVSEHAQSLADAFTASSVIPVTVRAKPVLKTEDAIARTCLEANAAGSCIGLVAWMHTFSPAKMWIRGLKVLQKPLVHLHTQYNRDIPWDQIDMDFMNLNQSAHGGREFGHMAARMGIEREVIVGHWQDAAVQEALAAWSCSALGWHELQNIRVARFGDNMRQVAVTEGDKVAAQVDLGFSVDGYGLGELREHLDSVSDTAVQDLLDEYDSTYSLTDALQPEGEQRRRLADAARIELGMLSFLTAGGYTAFTTTFEDLTGLVQLPGLAVQRLMQAGYGFGAEGDWKTAALVRAMKIMAGDRPGGTSFMEDYTYHFQPDRMQVLGAHMLEVCPSITAETPSLEIHPLSIGGKEDPVRLVFAAAPGPALNASLVDLGHRFRLIVNNVQVIKPENALPQLPVARALWHPEPELTTAAAAWIQAGGAHHTAFTQALTSDHLRMLADMAGLECVTIDRDTQLSWFRQVLRWNSAFFDRLR